MLTIRSVRMDSSRGLCVLGVTRSLCCVLRKLSRRWLDQWLHGHITTVTLIVSPTATMDRVLLVRSGVLPPLPRQPCPDHTTTLPPAHIRRACRPTRQSRHGADIHQRRWKCVHWSAFVRIPSSWDTYSALIHRGRGHPRKPAKLVGILTRSSCVGGTLNPGDSVVFTFAKRIDKPL